MAFRSLLVGSLMALAAAMPAAADIMTFDDITGMGGDVFTQTYTEDGFSIRKLDGFAWVNRNFGDPIPALGFMSTTFGFDAGGADFVFEGFGLGVQTGTFLQYQVTGKKAGATVFSVAGSAAQQWFTPVLSNSAGVVDYVTIGFVLSGTPNRAAAIDSISAMRSIGETGGGAGGSTPVPEPGIWALMISGFGLTGADLRRRRRAEGSTAAC